MKRVGDLVQTIISFENGVLKTLGPAILEGEFYPKPGECYILGNDIANMNLKATRLKLVRTGDRVWANQIYWMFADQTVEKDGKKMLLWDVYCKEAKEIIEVDFKDFKEDLDKFIHSNFKAQKND